MKSGLGRKYHPWLHPSPDTRGEYSENSLVAAKEGLILYSPMTAQVSLTDEVTWAVIVVVFSVQWTEHNYQSSVEEDGI